VTPERLIEGHRIGIATATRYPNWQGGETRPDDETSTDKIRGDLALETIKAALNNGYQIVVVDGGSSEAFVEAVRALGVTIQEEEERGMSAGRRQAFRAVSGLEGVDVVCWTEPEKVSFVQDCITEDVLRAFDDGADIVVPRRNEEAFASYPDYQADFERESNRVWNDILRRHGLLVEDAPDLDAWIGPRIIRNDPKILEMFMHEREFVSEIQSGLKQDAPGLWPDALFLPLIEALYRGLKIVGVDVPYAHPKKQTANEQDSEEFRKKRAAQQENILKVTIFFIHYLENERRGRLGKLSGIRQVK
jgi:glycosyltransferase involved in cell wall biosynthesis